MTKKDIIFKSIKMDIENDYYVQNQVLESENMLCKKFECSREPVRRALKLLKEKGYITSKQGLGYFINPREFYSTSNITSLSVEGYNTLSTEVLLFEKIKNNVDENFHSDYLFHFIRLRKNELNVIYEEGYINETLLKKFNKDSCLNSIYKYFVQHGFKPTHDIKEFVSVLIDEKHPINSCASNKIKCSIRQKHKLYSNENLVEISYQIKEHDKFTIIATENQ